MRRVIGIDVHRTFGEVVIWQNGLTRHEGRVEMTCTALEGFGRQLLKTDGVVVEPTGNAMAVLRVLTPFVARVVIANPLQVKAIAHAHVKTDKAWAGTLASLHAAGHLPEIWTPAAATGRRRRLVARRGAARRCQLVRHRTRRQAEVHAILAAHLIPKCPHGLSVQRARADGVGAPARARRRARGHRPARARARPARGRSGRARPRDRARRDGRRLRPAADDHHRRQPDGGDRGRGGHRRRFPLREPPRAS